MYKVPVEKMICDTPSGDGGVFFYDDYLEWTNRSSGATFKVIYKDISDVQVIRTFKKQVVISMKDGQKHTFMLYRADTFVSILYRLMGKAPESDVIDAEVSPKEDDLDKLERLAKLHESGALSDEEFAKAKEKILG